ncbi:hypothetical protein SAMN05192565_11195 [Methylobacterium gossipiicola]|uniref:Uncharacterized protein n=1 Tax=Methylobacterium gossipiicola TaxID=582675 RepID=A0A1I2UST2_9HYPH|nr:hypothetical protein SAMN05192565_11195 [Methylobacterium gossipiicola]
MPRPRKAITASDAERAANHRRRLIEAGGKRLQTALSPTAAHALDVVRQEGETDRAVLERVLIEAAARVR